MGDDERPMKAVQSPRGFCQCGQAQLVNAFAVEAQTDSVYIYSLSAQIKTRLLLIMPGFPFFSSSWFCVGFNGVVPTRQAFQEGFGALQERVQVLCLTKELANVAALPGSWCLNTLTAPAYNISGLKRAHTHTHLKTVHLMIFHFQYCAF